MIVDFVEGRISINVWVDASQYILFIYLFLVTFLLL